MHQFWLGTHRPQWLAYARVPLMVSARTLRQRTLAKSPAEALRSALGPFAVADDAHLTEVHEKVPALVLRRLLRRTNSLHLAAAPWVLDSGGFTEIKMHGVWTVPSWLYAFEIEHWARAIGRLEWAAPQDWMCEPEILARTGLTVIEHQSRTIRSVIALRSMAQTRVIPVLQGWTADDYERHVDDYARAGIDCSSEPVVGVGSICRRQGTRFAAQLMERLASRGIRIHGFGVKSGAAIESLHSADSLAWSYQARRQKLLMPGCIGHINCANCVRFALDWRERRLDRLGRFSWDGQEAAIA
jgi:hypothetical protein